MRRLAYVIILLIISQAALGIIEIDDQEESFTVNYQTKEIPVAKKKFLIQQFGKDYANIDYVAVKVGSNILPITSAKQGSTDVLNKLQTVDYDVIDLHNPVQIELPATGILLVNVNEHEDAHPLLWPTDRQFANIHAEPGSFVFDGSLDASLGSIAFTAYLEPTTGHPAGNIYGYARTDGNYLYIAMDVTIDNTNDRDQDWAAITLNTEERQRYYADRHKTTYGQSSFTYTPSVVYEHKVYEFKIPLSAIGPSSGADFEIFLEYYGTAGGSGVCGGGVSAFCDFGDAPDPFAAPGPATALYPTAGLGIDVIDVASPNGPYVFNGLITSTIILGAAISSEDGAHDCGTNPWCTDGDLVPNIGSSAGTSDMDSDDGLSASTLVQGGASSVTLDINNLAGGPATYYVNVWLDFNADGDWADAGEHVAVNDPELVPAGITPTAFAFAIPGSATPGLTWLRATATTTTLDTTPCDATESGCHTTGFNSLSFDGEIEDYSVTITAAVPEFGTLTLILAAIVALGGIFAFRRIR